tara:strand:+ start:9891 stop:11366 length:1476 start_codon:yes stop_codon:yes gene_type:complete
MEPTPEALAAGERAAARAVAAAETAERASAAFDAAVAETADAMEASAAPAVNASRSSPTRTTEALCNPPSTSEVGGATAGNHTHAPGAASVPGAVTTKPVGPIPDETRPADAGTRDGGAEELPMGEDDSANETEASAEEAGEKIETRASFAEGDAVAAIASFDGNYHRATVVRVAHDTFGSDGTIGKPRRYYVHFLGYDKRCDVWVDVQDTKKVEALDDTTLNSPTDKETDGDYETARDRTEAEAVHSPTKLLSKEQLLTRRQKRKLAETEPRPDAANGHEAGKSFLDSEQKTAIERKLDAEHLEQTPVVKNVETLTLGNYEMDCWYYSPFPESFWKADTDFNSGGDTREKKESPKASAADDADDERTGAAYRTGTGDAVGTTTLPTEAPENPPTAQLVPNKPPKHVSKRGTKPTKLFACEFCLKYMRKRKNLVKHCAFCPLKHPPGNEIYRQPCWVDLVPDSAGEKRVHPSLSVFEVDGGKVPVYCQVHV